MNEPKVDKQTVRVIDQVPPSWFKTTKGSSIWLTGYRVLRVSKEVFAEGPKVIDLSEVRAIVLYGSVRYFDASEAKIEVVTDHQWRLDASKFRERETSKGPYLLIMAPFDREGTPGNEPITREKVAHAAGLFAVFGGRNLVYEKLFDNVIEMDSGKTSSFSSVLDNPLWFPSPDLQESRLNDIRRADDIITALAGSERNRIRLSLRWFEAALYDSDVDSYVKNWIALETLGMPDTTNVRPLNDTLARAYGISFQEAQDRFAVGRLLGLRSRIVHDGQIVPIHALLLDYVAAIFVDVLFERLNISTERRAERVSERSDFNLEQFLHE